MKPEVTAAIIAGVVSSVALVATLVMQILTRRDTRQAFGEARRNTRQAFEEQHEQFEKTFAGQRLQLDRTLGEQRVQTLNERFATAASELGDDKPSAVRLAGVYAMAGLADDWPEARQTCVDVLCAYLRLPYDPDPGDDAVLADRNAYRSSREVRHTVIRVITAHLRDGATVSWQGLDFDFTGVVFDAGDFGGARFPRGEISFRNAEFAHGIGFDDAGFSGATVDFRSARFSGAEARFERAKFSGGTIDFGQARFSGDGVDFGNAEFSGAKVRFVSAEFSGGTVNFFGAKFSAGRVDFGGAEFSGSMVYLAFAEFSGGMVTFAVAKFSAGRVDFASSRFSGSMIYFTNAEFSGGTVDFNFVGDWSVPPVFPWADASPPAGVRLPNREDQSPA